MKRIGYAAIALLALAVVVVGSLVAFAGTTVETQTAKPAKHAAGVEATECTGVVDVETPASKDLPGIDDPPAEQVGLCPEYPLPTCNGLDCPSGCNQNPQCSETDTGNKCCSDRGTPLICGPGQTVHRAACDCYGGTGGPCPGTSKHFYCA